MIGNKYNKLTVLEKIDSRYYKCQCDCGNIKKIRKDHILNNKTKSCGCLRHKLNTEGRTGLTFTVSRIKLYKHWQSMKERCYNKNNIGYIRYVRKGF